MSMAGQRHCCEGRLKKIKDGWNRNLLVGRKQADFSSRQKGGGGTEVHREDAHGNAMALHGSGCNASGPHGSGTDGRAHPEWKN